MGQPDKNANPLLTEALAYSRRGWSIIPVPAGSKAARIKWGQYQKARADESQIRQWFSCIFKKNIAVILGPVSGGLCCRDFDKLESYRTWARNHPELVKILPIVRTQRGAHVYFVNRNIWGIRHFDDGELRAKGGYCLLPPSVHPNGCEYEWLNEPNGSIPEIDPGVSGMMGSVTEHTEQAEYTEANRAITGNKGLSGKIEKIIQKTLPTEIGTRNQKIFLLARELKSLPEFSESEPMELIGIVKEWHKRALPHIRTKEFEETKIDFLKAWPRITHKIGEEPMTAITKKAYSAKPPKIALEKYPDNPQLQIFVSLCRELQRTGGQDSFFVSCRKAAEILHTSSMTISRWFFLLESDGIVKTIEKGGTARNPRNASRYQYLGN